jgi:hypothetical protein
MRHFLTRSALVLLFSATLATQAFQVTTVTEQIPESNPVTRTVVSDAKTRFSFIAPRGWVSTTDPAGRRFVFELNNPRGSVILRLLNAPFTEDAAAFKADVLKGYQKPEVLSEFRAPSGGELGMGIELRHAVGGNFYVITRVVRFRTPDGSVEANLTASPDEFAKMHNAWTGFMNSFRVEKDSKPAAPAAPAR